MSQRHRIDALLREADYKEFRKLMLDRRITIDFLADWLKQRGYNISRSGVGRYVQKLRGKLSDPDPSLRTFNEDDLRKQIRKGIAGFDVRQLEAIARIVAVIKDLEDSQTLASRLYGNFQTNIA